MYNPKGMTHIHLETCSSKSEHQIHYHILLISTAFVGSSAFILGVDCFTTAGLKEVRDYFVDGVLSQIRATVLHLESWLSVSIPQVHKQWYRISRFTNDAN